MEALPQKSSWLQKFTRGASKFVGTLIPASGIYLAESQKDINESVIQNSKHLQEKREEMQLRQMQLSILQYHDNKKFQSELASTRYQQNIEIEKTRRTANEKLSQVNHRRSLDLQRNNQEFQAEMAALSHENQKALQQYRAGIELVIQDKNIDFQSWKLGQEKSLQLEIINARQEFDREIAEYNRETALSTIREQRRVANSPISLVPDDLLESPYKDGSIPVRILLSPPELNYDSFGQKTQGFNIESHLSEDLREFLDEYYPFNGGKRRTQLLDSAWISKKFRGGSGIQSLHSQLKTVPTIVLESDVDNNYLNFRVAYWRGDGSHYQYRSILSKFPYRDFLIESAKQRALQWSVSKQKLLDKGRDNEYIKTVGGENEFNLFLVEQERQLAEDGIDLRDTDLLKSYKVSYKDFKSLHQYLLTFHRITAGVVIDIHYLVQDKSLTPLLPTILSSLLEEVPEDDSLGKIVLEWLISTYDELYDRLTTTLSNWIPEIRVQFAIALASLEDKTYSKEQVSKVVSTWLKLRGLQTIDSELLHSVTTKDDVPFFVNLKTAIESIGNIQGIENAHRLLETWSAADQLTFINCLTVR